MQNNRKRDREDAAASELAAQIAQNAGKWPSFARDPVPIRIPITEFDLPDEQGDEISISEHGGEFVACFRETEFNGAAFGFGPCPLLAAADLLLQPWKG